MSSELWFTPRKTKAERDLLELFIARGGEVDPSEIRDAFMQAQSLYEKAQSKETWLAHMDWILSPAGGDIHDMLDQLIWTVDVIHAYSKAFDVPSLDNYPWI